METEENLDGETESANTSMVIQDFVFLCRKIDSR